MPWYRIVLCFLVPPLAVIDKGIKPVLLTTFLWFFGWIGGVICALIYCSAPKKQSAF